MKPVMIAPCTTVPLHADATPTAADIEARIDAWRALHGEPMLCEPEPVCERPTPVHRLRRARA
jgi:hypothetical protein